MIIELERVVEPGSRVDEIITLKHGAGGRAMRRLIENTLTTGFRDVQIDGIRLGAFDDGER